MELSKIKPFIDTTIYKLFEDDKNLYLYSNISNQAANLCQQILNYDASNEEWYIYPFALVVQYIAQNQLSYSDEAFIARIKQQFEEAKKILANNSKTSSGDLVDKIYTTEIINNDKF